MEMPRWTNGKRTMKYGQLIVLTVLLCGYLWSFFARPAGSHAAATNPFVGATWFIDPDANARRQAAAWRATRPDDAAALDLIAGQPQADWFGDFSGDARAAVDARVTQLTALGALPLLVSYNLPNRDCGGLSAGGATSLNVYRDWIRAFAEGIGARRAVVILEPDSLTVLDCLGTADQEARFVALKDAVTILKAKPQVAVYLAAGHSNWVAVEEIARRLNAAGVRQADGFALNEAHFRPTANEITYGRQIAPLVGDKHFVIDTSRNGVGPVDGPNSWCNPAGQGLGHRPAIVTDDPYLDAYLWIKRPGESDGACNGSPPAGQWWPEYALGLAQRAALDDQVACFAATAQCVGGPFLNAWRVNGGLALNGYPISDVRIEMLDDGKSYKVQYFERVRLEAHPENSPPYDIQLGLFGRQILAGAEDAPVAPVAPKPGATHFPQTGHNVSPRLLSYWQINGGLARFGYPLSEEFTETLEDGKPYTVQYFERARFELHPENAAPFDILLGQFGRRIMSENTARPKP
jgi:endoglucanase